MNATDIAAMGLQNAEFEALKTNTIPGYSLMAKGALDALKAAGLAVIDLPKSDEWGEWAIAGEDDFNVSPVPLMELATGDMQVGCRVAWGELVLNLSTAAARSLAAALLACAASAEAAEVVR